MEQEKINLLKELAAASPSFRRQLLRDLGISDNRGNGSVYYRKDIALGIQEYVDKQIEQKVSYKFPINFYGDAMSLNTLHNKIIQAAKYLVDNLDTTDKKYFKWRRCVEIQKVPGVGVIFKWMKLRHPEELEKEYGGIFYAVPMEEEQNSWKSEIYNWMAMEISTPNPFHKKGLMLDISEQKFLTELFSDNPGYTARITESEIKVIKEIIPNEKTNNEVCEDRTEYPDSGAD